MNEIQKFRKEADSRGLCERYSELWDKCTSNRQLFDLAMDSNGIPYVCESIANGWGLSTEYLAARFRAYVNNKYTSKHRGYSSKMFIQYSENVVVNTTNTILVDCRNCVVVPKNTICNLFLVNSRITVVGEGTCYVQRFGRSSIEHTNRIRIIKT